MTKLVLSEITMKDVSRRLDVSLDKVSDICEIQVASIVFWAVKRVQELKQELEATPKSDNPDEACLRGMVVGRIRMLQEIIKSHSGG